MIKYIEAPFLLLISPWKVPACAFESENRIRLLWGWHIMAGLLMTPIFIVISTFVLNNDSQLVFKGEERKVSITERLNPTNPWMLSEAIVGVKDESHPKLHSYLTISKRFIPNIFAWIIGGIMAGILFAVFIAGVLAVSISFCGVPKFDMGAIWKIASTSTLYVPILYSSLIMFWYTVGIFYLKGEKINFPMHLLSFAIGFYALSGMAWIVWKTSSYMTDVKKTRSAVCSMIGVLALFVLVLSGSFLAGNNNPITRGPMPTVSMLNILFPEIPEEVISITRMKVTRSISKDIDQ